MTQDQDEKTENSPENKVKKSAISTTFPGYQTGDDIPYIDAASPHTHPDCLYTMATLFGIKAAPVTKCRVLSLASFEGTNLIAMAAGLPTSQFVGLTHSQREYDDSIAKIKALNLSNIEIKLLDIMKVGSDFGEFDYILAQGLYSWVDAEKRKRILQLCRTLLRANGIIYVNYNSYPGWRMHNALRDMMLFHVRNEINNEEIVHKAREFTKVLANTAEQVDHLYGLLMQSQLEMIKDWSDDYLLHDTLGAINQPFYFYEFMEAATREQLQFLSDAEFHGMVPNKFPEDAIKLLRDQGKDRIAKEQYMDFFRNRMFKQTLLCHSSITLMAQVNFNALKNLYYTAPLSPVSSIPDIQTDKPKTFKTINNVSVSASDPVMKALLLYLSGEYPTPKNFDDIMSNLKKILGSDYQYIAQDGMLVPFDHAVMRNLLDGYGIGMLKVFAHPIEVTKNISDKPKISELAQYESKYGLLITNQLHEAVRIDVFTHHVLQHINGKNTIDDIVEILMGLVRDGKIAFRKGDASIDDVVQIREILQKRVENLLRDISKLALLVP